MNLDTLPIPTDADGPARAKVTTVGDEWRLAWARDGGLTVEVFGDPFPARINARTGQ